MEIESSNFSLDFCCTSKRIRTISFGRDDSIVFYSASWAVFFWEKSAHPNLQKRRVIHETESFLLHKIQGKVSLRFIYLALMQLDFKRATIFTNKDGTLDVFFSRKKTCFFLDLQSEALDVFVVEGGCLLVCGPSEDHRLHS